MLWYVPIEIYISQYLLVCVCEDIALRLPNLALVTFTKKINQSFLLPGDMLRQNSFAIWELGEETPQSVLFQFLSLTTPLNVHSPHFLKSHLPFLSRFAAPSTTALWAGSWRRSSCWTCPWTTATPRSRTSWRNCRVRSFCSTAQRRRPPLSLKWLILLASPATASPGSSPRWWPEMQTMFPLYFLQVHPNTRERPLLWPWWLSKVLCCTKLSSSSLSLK